MKYKTVAAARRGGPEVLRVVEKELVQPPAGKVLVRVLAAPVCGPDVQARHGHNPFAPRTPFVPGYSVIGVVEAVGEGVTGAAVGDRVGALTVFGGYAEYVYVRQEELIPVPATLDPAEAAPLLLNYLVAYQVLHRSARVKAGDRVLIVGASGGIGTALLELGRIARLVMYGIASKSKHAILTGYGATPIDYRTQDFVQVIRQAEPEGLDAVFDGMSGDYVRRGLSVLRRGGCLIMYGNPLSLPGLLRLLARMLATNVLPTGKTVKLYGTTMSRLNRRPFEEDWATLFRLLEEGEIKPIIMKTFPITEAAQANALLESGEVVGNVVLLAPELL